MAKRIHKADEYVLKQIASAQRFVAVMFLGSGRYLNEEFSSLREARARAERMTIDHSASCSGRKAWVSAIDDSGASHPVPDSYYPGSTQIGYVTALSRRSRQACSDA